MMKCVVLKFGTGVLAETGGCALDPAQFKRLAAEIAALMKKGVPCILVSSAAIAAGVHALGLAERPADVPGKQACAAVGQPALMAAYASYFESHGITTAQLLLTQEDIVHEKRRHNAHVTLKHLLSMPQVLPIINENDSVATDEITFGDNDQLSAAVAIMMKARLLILFTSTDGLIAMNGKVAPERIPVVTDFQHALSHVTSEKGAHSTGGMKAKLKAVATAVEAGIETVIASGREPGQLQKILTGEDVGTRFPAR